MKLEHWEAITHTMALATGGEYKVDIETRGGHRFVGCAWGFFMPEILVLSAAADDGPTYLAIEDVESVAMNLHG